MTDDAVTPPAAGSSRPRARGLGVPFDGTPGPLNAITDVPGLELGATTLIQGDGPLRVGEGPVRTGVTAILPRGHEGVGRACAAGWYSLNGNGEMTGTTWIEESGALTMPVLITNTHAVGPVHAGAVEWVIARHPVVARQWLLPVVAETWDGYLNDINGGHVTPEHARAALDGARSGPVAEGATGGGTGMTCYAFKGGSGTASRQVAFADDVHTVAVFVQANFGSRRDLRIAGCPVGRLLAADNPQESEEWFVPMGAGSVIAIVATDAPLLPGQCKALARRVPLGLARTGTNGSHFSGDIFLAFSTANDDALTSRLGPVDAPAYASLRFIPWGLIDPYYDAVVQATEEAVVNALVGAETMVGIDGHRSPALPHAALAALIAVGAG
ncbi:MAG TPA: P1 family peptidase [Solirubrobacteraceae bacterium]|jgi:L-aminopeptidase/D-esterase-like protein